MTSRMTILTSLTLKSVRYLKFPWYGLFKSRYRSTQKRRLRLNLLSPALLYKSRLFVTKTEETGFYGTWTATDTCTVRRHMTEDREVVDVCFMMATNNQLNKKGLEGLNVRNFVLAAVLCGCGSWFLLWGRNICWGFLRTECLERY